MPAMKPKASMMKKAVAPAKKVAPAKPKLGGAGNPNYVKDMVKKGKSKPAEITKGQQVRKQPAKKIIKKGMM